MKITKSKLTMFKIKNRKGYACVCLKHLTEGGTPFLCYSRMRKALKRSGYVLDDMSAADVKKLVK